MRATYLKLANVRAIETTELSFQSGFNLNAVHPDTDTLDVKCSFESGEEPR